MEILVFRVLIAILSLIPIYGAVIGFGPGAAYFYESGGGIIPVNLDNQFRYLSGVYLGVTAAAWWTLGDPVRRLAPIRFACLGVFLGGLGRLVSMQAYGLPSDNAMVAGVGIELVLVPLLLLWQTRLAAKAA